MKHLLNTNSLRFALLLAIFSSFTAAMAYDFEVDGICYNRTSTNTVEVTYKSVDYYGYNYNRPSIDIPTTVINDNVTYTVTAIGDSAFYDSKVYEVTIPSTITLIGRAAFSSSYKLTVITCLATTPPEMGEDCFSYHHYGYNKLPWYEGQKKTEYAGQNKSIDILEYSGWDLFLYVPEESFDDYKQLNEINHYFSFVINIGAGVTQFDEEGAEIHKCYVLYNGFNHSLETWSDWDQGLWFDYTGTDWGSSVDVYGYSYAIKEGKEPSGVDCFWGEHYSYYDHLYDSELLDRWEEDMFFYDFFVDGIYYRDLGNNEVAVAFDSNVHLVWEKWDYYYYGELITIDTENSYTNGDYCSYSGQSVVIPHTVDYNGVTYSVTSIDSYTFYVADVISFDYEYLSNPFDDEVICTGVYWATIGGGYPSCLSLPINIDYQFDSFDHDYNYNTFILTGEGEWSGGALDVAVQRLDIASGITAIPGLMVNPREVYCYAKVPPTCDENTFTDYTGTLHVPESSLAAYFTAPYWCNFSNIVGDAVELTSLTINKDSVELLVGEQLTLNASVQPANASVDNIEWSSSYEAIATVVDGVVMAKAKGECDIIATCHDKRVVCHLTVNEVLPESITLNMESALMEKDSTLTLTATILPENSTYKTVTWSSSNNAIATVNSNGLVTAKAEGECDITATCKGLTATCHVKVLERFIYITLDQHRARLLPNHILTLTPTVTPIPTDLVVTSSNPSVAAARLANGKVQVVGVTPGHALIKVCSADGKAFADSCVVDVYTEAGDVDLDGFVKIDDVTALIDYLLGSNVSPFDMGNADVNYDGAVTIADVTELIDYLLSGQAAVSSRETFTANGVPFTMVRVAGGTFMMGATEEQGADALDRERPVHQVTVSTYSIGETEVTQELWLAVMGYNPSKHTGDLQKPVEYVTWPECQEFITQLNALTGQHFRLPTEAEWEYAARGGNKSHSYKYAGSDNVDDVAWYTGTTTHPVASLQPNELFLYDMSGNVDEWINDYWSNYTSEPQTDPTGPETGTDHVYRGGSWYGGATASRVSNRFYRSETFRRGTMGLRLAL